MPQNFDTTVIIPCHNVENTLDLQLECLLHQENSAPFEVLVVNNKSTDNTREAAQRWQKLLNLRIIEAHEHAGVSYARNRGIHAALGEKLIFIDGDDAVPTNFVESGQRTLDEVPLYVAGFDPVESHEFSRGRDHVLSIISSKILPYQSPLPEEQNHNWPILPGGSFGALRSVMIHLGGFDLLFEPGAEDNEFAHRAISAGYALPVQRCTTIAYRVDSHQSRPLRAHYTRAKSVALLATVSRRWEYLISNQRHPLINLLKVLGATPKYLFSSHKRNWLVRCAMNLGLAIGFIEYSLLRKIPSQQPGIGMYPMSENK